jgi:hypothetical protein
LGGHVESRDIVIGFGHPPFNGGPITTPTPCQPFNRLSAIKRSCFVFNKKGGGDLPMFAFRSEVLTNLSLFVWRVHEIRKQMHVSRELTNKLA